MSARARTGWDVARTAGIVVAFAALFAFQLWLAVGNLVGLLQWAALLGAAINAMGWTYLVALLAVPVIAFVVALIAARGHGDGRRALLLLGAFAASSALSLSILHLSQTTVLLA